MGKAFGDLSSLPLWIGNRDQIMIYQSRKRNYKSRHEKLELHKRFYKRMFLIFLVGLAFWIFLNREDYWFYLKTYFY